MLLTVELESSEWVLLFILLGSVMDHMSAMKEREVSRMTHEFLACDR